MVSKRISKWQAEPKPFCITRLRANGYEPVRRNGSVVRFATKEEALREANRVERLPGNRGDMVFVDYASAYEAAA